MEENRNNMQNSSNPRRRKKSKMQLFKETYLPFVIIGVAAVLILVFVIGAIARGVQKNRAEEQAELAASLAQEQKKEELALQEQTLLTQADALAAGFDYEGAIAVLDTFEGDMNQYPTLSARRTEYLLAQSQLVAWDDPSDVLSLSFQMLIADLRMAQKHHSHSESINRNFITTGEFSQIIQELYDNGYILVTPNDFVERSTSADGQTVYSAKTLYLPAGRKPLMLTETNANYNLYLVDGDGDRKADQYGGGFASKMMLDANGDITCEMVNSNGQTVTGDFDMVPILDAFVEENPDFSYRGSKAVIALTGYNGLFGHRTDAGSIDYFGQAVYDDAVEQAKRVAARLQETGYVLACYTYDNIPYGEANISEIENDLNRWDNEVVPILGEIDVFVYAQGSDIASGKTYSGDKYLTLKEHGFNYFIGFCQENDGWFHADDDYARQGRILVTGSNLAHHSDWFMGMFYASNILDPARGTVPG